MKEVYAKSVMPCWRGLRTTHLHRPLTIYPWQRYEQFLKLARFFGSFLWIGHKNGFSRCRDIRRWDAPGGRCEIWSVIPRLSAMRSNCSMVGLSFPQLILFRYCLVQPNLLASSASLMHFSTNAFFKSIFVSNYFLIKLLSFNSYGGMSFFL